MNSGSAGSRNFSGTDKAVMVIICLLAITLGIYSWQSMDAGETTLSGATAAFAGILFLVNICLYFMQAKS